MKKNFLKFIVIGVLPLFVAISCSKDDDNKPLTMNEAMEVLMTTAEQMGQTMSDMEQTDAMQAIANFDELNNREKGSCHSLLETTQKLILIAGQPEVTPSLPFLASTVKGDITDLPFKDFGTYSWDAIKLTWTYKAEPANKMIFEFPSEGDQGKNNAVLTLWNVTYLEKEEDKVLTAMDLSLLINDTQVLSVHYKLNLDTDKKFTDLTLTVDMAPFFLSADINLTVNATGKKLNIQNLMKKNRVTIQSSNFQAQFKGLDLPDLFVKDGSTEPEEVVLPLTVEGFLQIGGVKATLNLNVAGYFEALQNGPVVATAYANKNMKIKLFAYPEGNPLAYIKWKYNVEEETLDAYLVFSDGQEMPLMDDFSKMRL